MIRLPGVGGALFPSHFLAQFVPASSTAELEASRRGLVAWWQRTDARCGPATGLRALFDLAAMPLAAALGYRAYDARFADDRVIVELGGASPGATRMLVLLWATRPSRRWNELDAHGAAPVHWGLVFAPPFLSVVNTRGHAFRRSVDFRFPDAIDRRSFPALWAIARADTLLTPAGDRLLQDAMRFQDGVRADLQAGVVHALGALTPAIARPGASATARTFDEALTIVYRILFLMFAESRALTPSVSGRYRPAYSIAALCRDALGAGDRRLGLWDGLAAITRLSRHGAVSVDFNCQAFNGQLFSKSSAPTLESGHGSRPTHRSIARDHALADALVALGTRPVPGGRQDISYADLGVEQLGAVYERVLDLDPASISAAAEVAPMTREHSRRRKETGTFYTPQALAEFVVRRTLAPLVHGATTDDILALRVVDPSMGSGAFLVAACRFLSDAYERALVDEGRLAETDLDPDARAEIRRLVASRCLAGVDANPVAVQLARLSLWLTTLARDKPLSFFDHQLRCGDSLVGCSPDDLWRVNVSASGRSMRPSTPLFDAAGLETAIQSIAQPLRRLTQGSDDTVKDVRERERLWNQIAGDDSPLSAWRRACDLWCARWFETSSRPSAPEFRALVDAMVREGRSLASNGTGALTAWANAAQRAARARHFFHWPIEFADLFYEEDGAPRTRAGFDAVIGNPPWEMLRGGDAARPDLVAFIRGSGLYPSCDRGHVNLYQPFLERSLALVRPGGRVGLILPWGAAVDDGAASLRRRLFERGRVDTIVGLDNSAGLFPIHRGLRFMVLVASPGAPPRKSSATFGVRTPEELGSLPGRDDPEAGSAFETRLDAGTLRCAGGPALRIPDARCPGDLDWLLTQCRRFPALGHERGWHLSFGRELNATEDRESFGPAGLPVIEGKHIGPFRVDAAAATKRISASRVTRLLPAAPHTRARLAYRDVSGAGNRRTLIAAVVPPGVVTTHTLFCVRTPPDDARQHFLCALFNSSPLNRIVRMLMGSHVTTGLVEHLPVPVWTGDAAQLALADLARALADAGTSETDRTAIEHESDERIARMYA